ncbi:MAG TPA: alpha/beta fold hydrolase [Polyangiaceae bacterium]|jgi:3-oxoadipate enol-lactonase
MSAVDSGGVRIAFEERGPEGRPVLVLLHALGTDRTLWAERAERWGGSLHVVCPDLRGHGASAAPPGPYAIADLGRDVLTVLDALEAAHGPRPVHVCGISLGGMVALWLAVRHGARLRTATVACSAARIGTLEGWQARMEAVARGGIAAVRETVLGRFFSPDFAARRPDVVARTGVLLDRTAPEGYTGCCAALRDEDLRGEVRAIRTPLLVVAAERDASCPPEQSRWLAGEAPGASLVEIPGAGHLALLERPDLFDEAIPPFLGAHP